MGISKPNNYEETQASGEYTPVELGGHKLVIKEVEERKSKSGKDMIVVKFDFSSADKQPGYFQQMYDDDIRPEKKWPNQATQYILTEDNDGNCNRSFKTFLTCVENSNAGFQVVWGNKFCACLKGKSVGGVFGTVEEYNGERKMKRKMRWFLSLDKVAEAAIPAEKYLTGATPANVSAADGFVNVPDGIDEELPFN